MQSYTAPMRGYAVGLSGRPIPESDPAHDAAVGLLGRPIFHLTRPSGCFPPRPRRVPPLRAGGGLVERTRP